MKKILILIPLTLIFCILLFYAINAIKEIRPATGFERKIIDKRVKLLNHYELRDRDFSFLWENNNIVWLLDYKNPLSLQNFDYSLNKHADVRLRIPKSFKIPAFGMYYDSYDSTVFINNRQGDIALISKQMSKHYKLPSLNLVGDFRVLSSDAMLVMAYNQNGDQTKNATELTKIMYGNHLIVKKTFLLPKQVDGIFCADGWMEYDKIHARIYYMYYYRGTFLCLDTNLNLVYQSKTIDTVRHAKIKILTVPGKGVSSLKGSVLTPTDLVNRSMCINNNEIYIFSGLKGDNESTDIHKRNAAIDVYNVKDGKYLYSFYLPNYMGNTLSRFKVKDNLILAMYKNHLVSFSFNNT